MIWIPVNDKYPPDSQGEKYLVCLFNGEVRIEKYYSHHDRGFHSHSWAYVDPSIYAWMPLPDLPDDLIRRLTTSPTAEPRPRRSR